MGKFKVLFLYPNGTLMNPPPIAIGIFTALLKKEGFELDLFDTTLYPEEGNKGSDDAKKQNLQVKPFDYGSRGVHVKKSVMADDLKEKIKEFSPDLILISILECTYGRALSLLDAIDDSIPVLAGGVFPTFAPELLLSQKNIDMVCLGEGEETVVEVCKRMSRGEDLLDISNLCLKKDGKIIKNPIKKTVDINSLPIPDYSLFEWERFCRPMAGRIYKTVPIETNRGCPYACSFCNSPSTASLYKDSGCTYFRTKKIDVLGEELKYLVKKWDAEYVYFTSDNFLVGPERDFDKFIDIYSDIRLPFWMQSRPETITEDRIRKLKEVGCHRMSLGLEHGNDEFRKRVLNKRFDNETMINASKIIADVEIPLTVNNMIGFPEETRELIFDTIELNRQITADSMNCSVFAPFHGTSLHKLCVERGYIAEDFILGSINTEAPLNMPQLSRDEIQGIRRTFVLYIKLDKKYWPLIKKAEKFDAEGDQTLSELKEIYARECAS